MLKIKLKKSPLVSVIMNCHNGEQFLKKSIDSIIQQDYKNWELIFFDNMSNDNSKKILKNYKDKRIKYFKSNKYLKLYAARNKAISYAKGKYISFLDTDDLWRKDKIKKQIRLLAAKNCSVVYSNYIVRNEKKNSSYLFTKNYLPSGDITKHLLKNYFIGIITTTLNKDIFKKFKFDDRYQIIGDFDFFIKLSNKYRFFSTQEPLATYRWHGKNFSNQKLDLYFKEMKYWLKNNRHNFQVKFNLNNLRFKIFKIKAKSILSKFF